MANLVRSKAKQQGGCSSAGRESERQPAGRLHEGAGDRVRREMMTLDRTRLIDLPFFLV
jgi:hypothetical protein